MPGINDVREGYADENPPVLLLLGLVSALRRLEPLLPPEPLPAAPAEGPGSGRFLCLVLGLIAFRQHLMATLALPPEPQDAPQPGDAGGPSLRELLR